jgi:hypothetical protein
MITFLTALFLTLTLVTGLVIGFLAIALGFRNLEITRAAATKIEDVNS